MKGVSAIQVPILIIDDVMTIRTQVRDLMRHMGFEKVFSASNPTEGMLIINKERIKVVLCDWHMEPTNGLDMLIQLRADSRYDSLAFLMVTAETTKDRVLEAIAAGLDDYIVKPLSAEKVKDRLIPALQKRKLV